MTQQLAFRDRMGETFGLKKPPTLVTQTLMKGNLAVTQLRMDEPNHLPTQPIPPENAFLATIMLTDCGEIDYWLNGQLVPTVPKPAGSFVFHDLRDDPIAIMRCPLRSLMFYLPRRALDEIADHSDSARIETLHYKPQEAIADVAFAQLGRSLLPAFQRPDEVCGLFIDHVLLAASAHIAHTYGGMRIDSKPIVGGLAPWQERRAKELLSANLDGNVSLINMATECGLSVGHFARAFRQSTGTAPHRWLLEQRVEKAKGLLSSTPLSIAEIALACGFAHQSHFTRTFTRAISVSPGTWRRARIR